jgi:hypothetical protein
MPHAIRTSMPPPPHLALGRALVPSHSAVDDPTERAHYWAALLEAWGSSSGARGKRGGGGGGGGTFPGANPISLSRAALPQLRAAPHVVALKSDGVRYALLLTLRPCGSGARAAPSPVALMVDRAGHMYEVEVVAPEDHFVKGTLLEGELVWRQPEGRGALMLFLVFDAVRVKGVSLLHAPFVERLEAARRCTCHSEELARLPDDEVESRVAEADAVAIVHFDPPLAMRPKRFVDRAHAAQLWSERGESECRVDGLVLQRSDAAYVRGTAGGAAYKWKPTHSVDLAGPADALRGAEGPLGATVEGRTVRVLPSRVATDGKDGVAEYDVDVSAPGEVRLFAMRTRPDKCAPNGLRVVAATVRDAEEAIRVDEL